MKPKQQSPRVLFFDIETSPIEALVWDIWEQNISLSQIKKDWSVLAWAANWLGSNKIIYKDQRKYKTESKIRNDKSLLKDLWNLLDEADIVVTQNGKKFDSKKLNARFIQNGMGRPSPYKHIDTAQIARSKFGFTSNKLEYLTDKLCTKYKKQKNSGFSLWIRCLKGDLSAWKEMERYNKYDVLSLKELWTVLMPWDNSVNFELYNDEAVSVCHCGSHEFQKRGFEFTASGKFQRFQCKQCGTWSRGKTNLLSKEKKKSLKVRVP